MNILRILTDFANRTPDKPVLINQTETVTYQQLEQTINKTANAFEASGIQKNDRVLMQIGNRFEFVYCYFAAMKMGAIVVPINPLYTPNEMEFIAANSSPTIYICEQSAKQNIETIKENSTNLEKVLILDETDDAVNFSTQIANQSVEYEFDADDFDVCQILYTSGTTGNPKGAMLTHDGLAGNAAAYKERLQCNENDIGLIIAPLYHAAAQTNMLNTMIISNGANYILEKFDPAVTLDIMEKAGITYFFGPPTMYSILLNQPDIEQYKLDLRIAFTGAAPMAVSTHERWKELFGFDILEGYGLTECSPIVTNHSPDGPIKHGSIGPSLKGVEVKVFDGEGNEVPVGEIGEIVVRGPNVMKGYWNMPEENERVFFDDWFRTGDVGYQDEDDFFYIVDRTKDVINQSGLKIYPREAEEVLYKYGSFLDVAVVGEKDEIRGEKVVAFVTLKKPAEQVDFDDVKTYCRAQLAPYKIPQNFYTLDEMPKTLSGKILKTKLIKRLEQRQI